MTNWKLMKYISIGILAVAAVLLAGFGNFLGIDVSVDKILGFNWYQIIAAGLVFVIFTINRLVNN